MEKKKNISSIVKKSVSTAKDRGHMKEAQDKAVKAPKPAGRKALPKELKRDKPVPVYLNQIEFDFLSFEAKKDGKSPAKYLRKLIDDNKLLENDNVIRLWIGNKLDNEILMSYEDVITGFLESEFYKNYKDPSNQMFMEHFIRTYITFPEGLNASFDIEEYNNFYEYALKNLDDRNLR